MLGHTQSGALYKCTCDVCAAALQCRRMQARLVRATQAKCIARRRCAAYGDGGGPARAAPQTIPDACAVQQSPMSPRTLVTRGSQRVVTRRETRSDIVPRGRRTLPAPPLAPPCRPGPLPRVLPSSNFEFCALLFSPGCTLTVPAGTTRRMQHGIVRLGMICRSLLLA